MAGYYVENAKDQLSILSTLLIKGERVGCWDSVTLEETGVYEYCSWCEGRAIMEIVRAEPAHFDTVKRITHDTITQIYPHYYPTGVVTFFQEHHNDHAIMTDITLGNVFMIRGDAEYIGTVTIDGNEINRLFVLPEFQNSGYGTALMEYAENLIFENFSEIRLHASLPGKKLYVKRAFYEVEYRTKMVAFGDWLCIDIMKKNRP